MAELQTEEQVEEYGYNRLSRNGRTGHRRPQEIHFVNNSETTTMA